MRFKPLTIFIIVVIVLCGCKHEDVSPEFEKETKNITHLFSSAKLKSGSVTIDQVIAGEKEHFFTPLINSYGVGNTSNTYWFTTNLTDSELSRETQYIEIPFALLDRVEVWFVDLSNSNTTYYKSGAEFPFSERSVQTSRFAFKIPKTNSSEIKVVVAINTASVVNFSPILWGEKSWVENQSNIKLWYGLLAGSMIMLILYNLSLSAALNDIGYFYYALYLFGITAYNATSAGLMDQFLWPNVGGISSQSALFLIAFTALFDFLFINNFFKIKILFPNIWKLTVALVVPIVPASLPELLGFIDLGVLNDIFISIVVILSFIIIIIYWFVAIAAYRKGVKQARFFILAFTIFIASYLVYQSYTFQLIEYNPYLIHILELGTFLEGIFLSLALADRINILSAKKQAAEQLTLNTNAYFVRSFIQAQEKERAFFSATLHDSIGHGLLVLKQNLENILRVDQEEVPSSKSREAFKNEKLEILQRQAKQCNFILKELKSMSQDLHPHILKTLGLQKAIELTISNALDSLNVTYQVFIENIPRYIEKEKQIVIYRVIQESLNNIIKHSQASEVNLYINIKNSSIQVKLTDNGVGFKPLKQKNKGLGLKNIEGRITIFGGKLSIDSHINKGTVIFFSIPINIEKHSLTKKLPANNIVRNSL